MSHISYQLRAKIKDLTGMRFGSLTVIGLSGIDPKYHRASWVVLCDCGHYTEYSIVSVQIRKSCGCRSKLKRFWSNIRKTKTCWLWTGRLDARGYGTTSKGPDGFEYHAHRTSWRLAFGDIPNGIHICHKCDNPRCVNPDHLFLGTPLDNKRDSQNKGRHAKGSRIGLAKLNDQNVVEIRKLYKEGSASTELANKYGVTRRVIWLVVTKRAWAHVAGDAVEVRPAGVFKLTYEKVDQIRHLAKQKQLTHRQIANQFGISRNFVYQLANGRSWGGRNIAMAVKKHGSKKRVTMLAERVREACGAGEGANGEPRGG